MAKIFGYGEDCLTLWTLKQRIPHILEQFQDKTMPSNCLVFYRPSFGRRSKKNSSIFGEFDALLASSENIYLIESKWDNLTEFKNDKLTLNKEQKLRHQIFSWYLTHWSKRYYKKWESFVKEQQHDFKFQGKTIAPAYSLLATNLEFILNKLLEHCTKFSSNSIKNVLLFLYNKEKSTPPSKTSGRFKLVPLDYSKKIRGNFVTLCPAEDNEST